jgi:hypothetical protein
VVGWLDCRGLGGASIDAAAVPPGVRAPEPPTFVIAGSVTMRENQTSNSCGNCGTRAPGHRKDALQAASSKLLNFLLKFCLPPTAPHAALRSQSEKTP